MTTKTYSLEEWYGLFTDSSYEYEYTVPEVDTESLYKLASSSYPLRPLGHTRDGQRIQIKEEDRSHAYIIGSTQEGKSKFIEHLVRGDIKRGLGCCVLDPTMGGKTVYSILKYCIKNKVANVLLIDPKYAYDFPYMVPQLSPFVYGKGTSRRKKQMRSTRLLEDTLRAIYGDDEQVTTRINTYLPALITILYNAKANLHDFVYFTTRQHSVERARILSHTPQRHPARVVLEAAYGEDAKSKSAFDEARTTMLRVRPLIKDTLALMFMSSLGVNFYKMVKEQWVILVNLSQADGFGNQESKLLGTLIINQIIAATDLYSRPFIAADKDPPPYYLYIDEAANFIGEEIAWTMEHAQKTGLKVAIGHQSGAQFSDTGVLNRIMTVAKMRVQFSLPGRVDRSRMVREMKESEADETVLAVQEARIELPKKEAIRVRTPTVKNTNVSAGEVKEFIFKLFKAHPWYADAKALQKQLDQEYADEPKPDSPDTGTTRPREAHDGQAPSAGDVSGGVRVDIRKRREQARAKAGRVASGGESEEAPATGASDK